MVSSFSSLPFLSTESATSEFSTHRQLPCTPVATSTSLSRMLAPVPKRMARASKEPDWRPGRDGRKEMEKTAVLEYNGYSAHSAQ